MLRKDKAITDRANLDLIIQQSDFCHIACSLDDKPYLLPISFGYDGHQVYLHTAAKGKKIEIISQNSQVCLSFVSQAKLIKDPDQACDWSFDYASVIIKGEAVKIDHPEKKRYALNQIMLHYSGKSWNMPEKEVTRTMLWSVSIQEITGKGSLQT
jgi:nitroimidazol reductase NimA-like FMN-containing flavoprotein (pyridoxamine 5'-phosphate oxidase superfamily)